MVALARHPALDELLCFDLYAASRAMTNLFRPMLTELGLTYPQYLVLVVLWENDQRTVKELGEVLRLDHGTLTPLLRRMETHGLLSRRRSSNDERFVDVVLTPAGHDLRDRAEQVRCQVNETLGLDDHQAAALRTSLKDLTRRVTPESADTGPVRG